MKVPPQGEYCLLASPCKAPVRALPEEPVRAMSVDEIARSKDLCAAMAHMSSAVRQLLGVMRRHNCITAVPDSHLGEYESAMSALATSVAQAQALTQQVEQQARDSLDGMPVQVLLRQ